MHKPLITLVTLGSLATGVAAQQSTATLYGLIDLSVQHLRSGDASPLGGRDSTRLTDGVVYGGPGSRWGLRVLEDLGDGLSALAVLEAGFNADNGTLGQGGRAFGRQVYVGMRSAKFGEFRLGRQYALHDETMAVTNVGGNLTPLNPGTIATVTSGTTPATFSLFIDAPRVDNAIHYLSPLFGGFRVQAMVALGEKVMDRYQALKASYAQGPVSVAAVYEQSDATNPPPGTKSTVNKVLEFGGNYDFGPVALYAGYQRGRDLTAGPQSQIQMGTLTFPGLAGAATDLKAYTVGVGAPIGAATRLMAQYTHGEFSNGSGDVTGARTGVGATYNFSKRTLVYGTMNFMSGDLKDDVNEKQLYQVGLRTTF